jgi:hypothetical protein
VQFVLDRRHEVVFAFHKRRRRVLRRTARLGTVSESASPAARLQRSTALLRALRWTGALGVETIDDPRDGRAKLMEVNPRFPRQLWNRTEIGINEPLMCVRLARGEDVAPVPPCDDGLLFVSPVEDTLLFGLQLADAAAYTIRTRWLGRAPIDADAAPPTLRALVSQFAATYRGRRRRVLDPYFHDFFRDPVVSGLWWLEFSTWIAGSLRHIGK